MDALNLAQKVYNMLNRIVVSGGTYRDWLETVYTGSNYFERCETPIFEGGTSQEIVFQEVVSNSASQDEPLGTLAGRGVTTGKQRGGHIKIKVTEPGYIMCISSITPRIDYSQGKSRSKPDTRIPTRRRKHSDRRTRNNRTKQHERTKRWNTVGKYADNLRHNRKLLENQSGKLELDRLKRRDAQ